MQHGLLQNETKLLMITILAVGSRENVQPYYALALPGLRRAGHQVRIIAHANFAGNVREPQVGICSMAVSIILHSEEGRSHWSVKLVSDELFQQQ